MLNLLFKSLFALVVLIIFIAGVVFDAKFLSQDQFSDKELRIASVQGIIDDKVIALGGVTFDKLSYLESLNFGGVAMIGDLYKL